MGEIHVAFRWSLLLVPTMSQLITGAAKRVAGNKVQEFAKAFEPEVCG